VRIATVVGARPQFIKAASLSLELRREHEECLIHTGQHYDDNMSDVFFRELDIPPPDYHLGVGSGAHGSQTAAMLERIESVLEEVQPDAVVVFGDTNSTLSGALAAAKMHIPVAHVEAGLRSFNRDMPEEINRIVTDRVSRWLFAPSKTAVSQLAAEGILEGVHEVGDIMADCVRLFGPVARERSDVLDRLGVRPREYGVATVHRAANADSGSRLRGVLDGLGRLPFPVVLPLHPRTEAAIRRHGLDLPAATPVESCDGNGHRGLYVIEPLGYLDMLRLEQEAAIILTDSGGIQKEAYYLGIPCVTLREETECVETVELGWNRLAGAEPAAIEEAVRLAQREQPGERIPLYGDGRTGRRICTILCSA